MEPIRPSLLDKYHILAYLWVLALFTEISVLYRLTIGGASGILGPTPGPQTPYNAPAPTQSSPGSGSIWPLWGFPARPLFEQVVFAAVVIMIFGVLVLFFRRRGYVTPSVALVTTVVWMSILATSLFQGWEIGIVAPVGGPSEILSDAVQVRNPLEFIAQFVSIQDTLSVHARTQPPGAVLTMYVLYVLLGSPWAISVGMSLGASVASAYFIHGIYRRLFDSEAARYGCLLYLLLPAVQVYYLANIYAVVAALMVGLLYFYLHDNRSVRIVGSTVCMFLGSFITFLFVYAVLYLFLFEVMRTGIRPETGFRRWIESQIRSLRYLFAISALTVASYIVMFATLSFNYIAAFQYAAFSENPRGFTLLANPVEYVITRLQCVLDIVFFFGPVLTVLAYKGAVQLCSRLKTESPDRTKHALLMSSLAALLILFLTGAPKKGETARICLFVLPVLLVPVLAYVLDSRMDRKEKGILLVLVFVQTVLMQLFGVFIW
ncbi:MAG: hypothetical protein HXY34_08740 [Candidatus Thorarchaeota archaeon]|nr:hypothetical protein [Candidatus Thorarchaeota archaeon]